MLSTEAEAATVPYAFTVPPIKGRTMNLRTPRRRWAAALVIAAVAASAAIPAVATAGSRATHDPGVSYDGQYPVVRTDAGRVRGEADAMVTSFKGIPFAAPPVGALRSVRLTSRLASNRMSSVMT